MRLAPAFSLALLLAPSAAANEPLWSHDERQAKRDAVFAGRVESTTRLYEVEPPEYAEGYEVDLTEEVWVARVEVLDVRKGHPLLEAGPVVDVYFVRPAHGMANARCPTYVALAPGEERLFFAKAAVYPVTGEDALFADLGSDVGAGVLASPRTGHRLLTERWRVWSPAFPGTRAGGVPIRFDVSGRAQSDVLAGVERWRLTGDGTLELLSEKGSVSYRFRPRAGSFFAHSFGEGLSTEQVVWLGTEGSDFEALSPSPPGSFREPLPEQTPDLGTVSGYHQLRAPVQDYLVPYTLGRLVNGRYVLWWPTGEGVDDERERFSFDMHQHRILMLFERMELEGGS